MKNRLVIAGGLGVLLAFTTMLAGCGDDDGDDDGDDAAAADPPWCLSEISLPDDAETIEATLATMPDEFAGEPRELTTSAERIDVYYDEPLEGAPSLQAISVDALEGAADGTVELTGFEAMEILLAAGQEPVGPGGVTGEMDEISVEPDDDLVWATGDAVEVGETPADDIRAPSVTFADPDGRWIFTVIASTPEQRVDLVEAFCTAVA